MYRVAEITLEQAFELKGHKYSELHFFNPLKINGKWYISEIEVNECQNFEWVKKLEIIEIEKPVEEEEL